MNVYWSLEVKTDREEKLFFVGSEFLTAVVMYHVM
jgi:hypothetical protein